MFYNSPNHYYNETKLNICTLQTNSIRHMKRDCWNLYPPARPPCKCLHPV